MDGEETGAAEDISKWSVEEVCSFISSLAGCGEYTQVRTRAGAERWDTSSSPGFNRGYWRSTALNDDHKCCQFVDENIRAPTASLSSVFLKVRWPLCAALIFLTHSYVVSHIIPHWMSGRCMLDTSPKPHRQPQGPTFHC